MEFLNSRQHTNLVGTAQNAESLHIANGGNVMDEKDMHEDKASSAAGDVESTTRDDKHMEESKEFESMLPA